MLCFLVVLLTCLIIVTIFLLSITCHYYIPCLTCCSISVLLLIPLLFLSLGFSLYALLSTCIIFTYFFPSFHLSISFIPLFSVSISSIFNFMPTLNSLAKVFDIVSPIFSNLISYSLNLITSSPFFNPPP